LQEANQIVKYFKKNEIYIIGAETDFGSQTTTTTNDLDENHEVDNYIL